MPSHPPAMSWLLPALRPTPAEIETYTRIILDREGVNGATYATCREEAEFQLWVWRCLEHRGERHRRPARIASRASSPFPMILAAGG